MKGEILDYLKGSFRALHRAAAAIDDDNALIPNISPAQILQPFLDYALGFRRGVDAGQPPDNAGPRAEIPFPVNGIPQPGDLPPR